MTAGRDLSRVISDVSLYVTEWNGLEGGIHGTFYGFVGDDSTYYFTPCSRHDLFQILQIWQRQIDHLHWLFKLRSDIRRMDKTRRRFHGLWGDFARSRWEKCASTTLFENLVDLFSELSAGHCAGSARSVDGFVG